MQIMTSFHRSISKVPLIVVLLIIASPAASVDVGSIPPDYLGKSESGSEIHVSDSRGRITIISFWATWCAPCLKELPVLDAIQSQGGVERIQVIAVNLKEPRRQYRKALRIFDGSLIEFVHDRRGAVAKRYDVDGIPHMLIVDVDGRVAYRHIGYGEDSLDGIVSNINALLIKNEMAEAAKEKVDY